MKIQHDKTTDSVYISIHQGTYYVSKKIGENIVIDIDRKNNVLGIEILEASKNIDEFQNMQFLPDQKSIKTYRGL